jgi:hypothetical protein
MLRRLTFCTLMVALAGWLGLSTIVVIAVTLIGGGPNSRAVVLMGSGLVALVEETIATGMTNLVPLFVVWAAMLRRVDFRPNAVFLLFGLTGTLAEAGFGCRDRPAAPGAHPLSAHRTGLVTGGRQPGRTGLPLPRGHCSPKTGYSSW